MRYLIAPDSFKGTLTAEHAAQIIADALLRCDREADFDILPLADGGEGTLSVLQRALNAEEYYTNVQGLFGEEISVPWLGLPTEKTAFIESATCLGLPLVPREARDPARYGSGGFGTLLRHVLREGYTTVYCALGGTATNDCGMGFAASLGYSISFFDQSAGLNIPEQLAAVRGITTSVSAIRSDLRIIVLADVSNPLLGVNGCTNVFGPQKNILPQQLAIFEAAIAHFSLIVKRDVRDADDTEPGCGAAGGLGFALRTFCNARLQSGSQAVLDLLDFDSHCSQCDIVITGEGKIDAQTLSGKVVGAVAERARILERPVVAFSGRIGPDAEQLRRQLGLVDIIPLVGQETTTEEALKNAEENLFEAAIKYFSVVHT